MVVMEAVMVQLPFAGSFGAHSLLHELVESSVDVKTFGAQVCDHRLIMMTDIIVSREKDDARLVN